jgi:predicted AlkP superfamily phosphohydrolase/phosphomutase
MYDWSRTCYFPVPMDETGYLRVNLRGRERDGIVAPDGEYDEVCAGLEALIAGLRDESSAHPIAGPAVRAYRDAGPHAPRRDLLPDLIVPFGGPPAAATRRLVSTTLPGFRYDVPARLPSGRSGNHRAHGWIMAAGPGVAAGTTLAEGEVLDLLPTIRIYLGLPAESGLPGRAIREITGA